MKKIWSKEEGLQALALLVWEHTGICEHLLCSHMAGAGMPLAAYDLKGCVKIRLERGVLYLPKAE